MLNVLLDIEVVVLDDGGWSPLGQQLLEKARLTDQERLARAVEQIVAVENAFIYEANAYVENECARIRDERKLTCSIGGIPRQLIADNSAVMTLA